MNALGTHILVEFFGCTPEIMNEVVTIETGMVDAARKAGATVINSTFHHFSPYGVSGVVVIEESHLAIHTWPEYGYAAVDLFTCGDSVDPWLSFDHLKEVFQAKNYSAIELHRGPLNLLTRQEFDLGTMRSDAEERVNPDMYTRNIWFTDRDENQALSLRHSGNILYDKRSEFQRTKIIETYGYGLTLTIDNMIMCTERDEKHYHEMIAHPAVFAHGAVKKVLVIGGGDGGTIRELFKHEGIESVVMVEIDGNVIEASKAHLPALSSAFDHPKLDLRIADGIRYVAEMEAGQFDLILVDGSDPVGPAQGLFTKTFYENCKRGLSDNGLLVVQGESPMFNQGTFVELNACLKEVYGSDKVNTMLFSIPTYPSGIWSFQVASKGAVDVTAIDDTQVDAFDEQHGLHYYNAAMHTAAFSLPNYVKKMLNE